MLWLPFRREDLRPAPGVGFSSAFPSSAQTIAELARPETWPRFSPRSAISNRWIRENGSTVCAVELKEADGRLVGPSRWPSGERPFRGTVKIGSAARVEHFVGREAMATKGKFLRLRSDAHWPKTISVLSPTPQPQKGEPHAAATLLRASRTGLSELRISWAVFLPVSEDWDIVIPLEGKTIGHFRMQLHGYFFLDSGRSRIEFLASAASDEDPADAAALRRTWNTALRDTVLLPLVQSLLRDGLDATMVSSAELSELVSSVANDWFERNRRAICRENALVRVLEPSGSAIWKLAPTGVALYPLPASVENARQLRSSTYRAPRLQRHPRTKGRARVTHIRAEAIFMAEIRDLAGPQAGHSGSASAHHAPAEGRGS